MRSLGIEPRTCGLRADGQPAARYRRVPPRQDRSTSSCRPVAPSITPCRREVRMKVRRYAHLVSERSGWSATICKLRTERWRGAQSRPVTHLAPLPRSNARSATRPNITRITPVTRGKLGAAAVAGSQASSTADAGPPRLRADSVAELRVRLLGGQDHVILDRVLALDVRECVLG